VVVLGSDAATRRAHRDHYSANVPLYPLNQVTI